MRLNKIPRECCVKLYALSVNKALYTIVTK
jgi:hypothetical protein